MNNFFVIAMVGALVFMLGRGMVDAYNNGRDDLVLIYGLAMIPMIGVTVFWFLFGQKEHNYTKDDDVQSMR